MTIKKETPSAVGAAKGEKQGNGTNLINFSEMPPATRRIHSALLTGQHTTAELVMETGVADPRSHIRYLRNGGIPVNDYWLNLGDRTRMKVYFIQGSPINKRK